MITAPFNFVPLSEKVFFPDWANDVSHDIPFEDSQSGSIDITITAKSPIFIRNHSSDKANPSSEFCNYNGTPYIPSSSVKGMVRSVLEIMSFGKIRIDNKIHKKTMSVRDMTNRKEMVGTATGCGFLKQNSAGEWYIEDYGKPRTIEYVSKYNKTIKNSSINCDFDTAKEKYRVNGLYKKISVKNSIKKLYKDGQSIGIKGVAEIVNGQDNAYLILTGGIDNKVNEFVFVDSDKGEDVFFKKDIVDKFKKVYFESDSVDGNFWRDNYDKDIGIPIFYIKDKKQKITDIGLSQLFKLAYNYTIDEATKQRIETVIRDEKIYSKLDLTEILFGTVQEEKNKRATHAFKGRVQFSHFKLEGEPNFYETKTVVLGSPNASFYPEYIKQDCNKNGKLKSDNYNSLMDSNAQISGWKRYPLHHNKINIQSVEESDSTTTFEALGNYTNNNFNEFTFSGKLRFHNLKKVELGALLSALTFHHQHDTFYHNIGMAKSLGLGKIKIDVALDNKCVDTLKTFEYFMDNWVKENNGLSWLKSEQIKELFTMAYKDLNIDSKLKYLVLDPENRINKFVDAKKRKHCLPRCSELFDIGENYPKSLIKQEDLDELKKEEELEESNNKKKEEEREFQEKLEKMRREENLQKLQNFIDKHSDYEKIDEIVERKKQIEQAQKDDKYQKVNEKFDSAYDVLQNKKGNQKQYQEKKDKFIEKWSAKKNNKGSKYILEMIEKIIKETK